MTKDSNQNDSDEPIAKYAITTLPDAPVQPQERRNIIKRFAIIIGGTIVVLVGIALLVLPGPAFVVIPAGLAILGTELVWARRLLQRVKRTVGLDKKCQSEDSAHDDQSQDDENGS